MPDHVGGPEAAGDPAGEQPGVEFDLARRVPASVGQRVAARLATMVIGASTLSLLSRYLGVRDFGYYMAATSLLSLIWMVADGGIVSTAVRGGSRTGQVTTAYAGVVTGAQLVTSMVAAAVAIAVAAFAYSGHEGHLVLVGTAILSLTLPITALSGGVQTYAQTHLRVGRLVLADVAGRAVVLSLVIVIVTEQLGLLSVFGASAGGSLVTLVILAMAYRAGVRVTVRVNRASLRLMKTSWSLGLALVINAVYFRADTLLVSWLRPAREVALYGLDYRIMEFVLTLGAFFVSAMLPVLSAMAQERERWRRTAERALGPLFAAGLALAVCTSQVARDLIRPLGGGQYLAGAPALAVLLLAGALSWVSGLIGTMLISAERQRQALWVNAAGLIFNLSTNIALIPVFGYLAAAWITVASEFIFLGGALYVLWKQFGFLPRVPGWKPAVLLAAAAAGATAGLKWLGLPGLVAAGLVGLAWVVAARLSGVVPRGLLYRGHPSVSWEAP